MHNRNRGPRLAASLPVSSLTAPIPRVLLYDNPRTHQPSLVRTRTTRLLPPIPAALTLRICAFPASPHAQTTVFV